MDVHAAFDSSFLFGSLLDEEKGGHFYISPQMINMSNSSNIIFENTNLLCTEFASADGRFKVIDCAPRMTIHESQFKPLMLVRKIELISGTPVIKVRCEPSGNYGKDRSRNCDRQQPYPVF